MKQEIFLKDSGITEAGTEGEAGTDRTDSRLFFHPCVPQEENPVSGGAEMERKGMKPPENGNGLREGSGKGDLAWHEV